MLLMIGSCLLVELMFLAIFPLFGSLGHGFVLVVDMVEETFQPHQMGSNLLKNNK